MKYLYTMIDLTNAIKVSETSKGEVILGTLYYENERIDFLSVMTAYCKYKI